MEKEEFIPKTKHKGLKIFIATLLILGMMAGGYFIYQYKFTNPKTIINKLLDSVKANVKSVSNIDTNKYKFDGLVKIDTNILNEETSNIIKNISLQINGQVDTKDKIGNLNINTKYKEDKFLDINAYYEKDNIYVKPKDLYDKYIKIENKTEINKDNANSKDVQVITNSIVNALKKEVNKLTIEQTNSTITINGKNVDTIEYKITLKNEEINNISKNILNTLKEDKEFIKSMDKLSNENTLESINELINNINDKTNNETYLISVYTNKGIFNKELVSVRIASINNDTNNKEVLEIDKISNDETNVLLSTLDGEVNIRVKQNRSAANLVINFKQDQKYANVEFSINYEKINTVTKPDVSNSKNINELTEQEITDIQTKFAENKVLLKLMEELSTANDK